MSTPGEKVWTAGFIVFTVIVLLYTALAIQLATTAESLPHSVGLKLSVLIVMLVWVFAFKARFGGIRARGREA